MNLTDYKYYNLFLTETPAFASLPKNFREAPHFQNLLNSKILEKERSGRGQLIIVKKPELFRKFLAKHFPDQSNNSITKNSNIKLLRNSKSRRVASIPVFLLRGFKTVHIGSRAVNLASYTDTFGLFSIKDQALQADKICFVENLEPFLNAEKLLGKDYIYVHKYGRIGKSSLKGINAKEILVFVDYDFNGMEEYLRVKEVYPQAKMYFPENFQVLFETYSRILDKEQKLTKRILECTEENIVLLKNLIQKNNRFLEQEILVDV